jgi:hypothetical protein
MNKHITKFTIDKSYGLREVKNIKMFLTTEGETVELPYEILTVDYNSSSLVYNPSGAQFTIDEMEDLPF